MNAKALLPLMLSAGALAQTTPTPLPQARIPTPVLMELRAVESQFDLALGRDCAPERCVSKGCAYTDHAVVDVPRASSLPGIPQTDGPGGAPPQEYLTAARCDFAHEKSVSPKDAQALVRRLEQRLSKGWLRVTVGHQVLEPVSPALAESPPPKPELVAPPSKVEPVKPPEPPAKWEAGVALRELWVHLLPHFFWMVAVFLGTLAALTLIWAYRRVGRESAEEKAIAAQLAAGVPQAEPKALPAGEASSEAITEVTVLDQSTSYVIEQQQLWRDRIAHAELAKDESVVVELLRQWLRAGEFALLAKAIFVFGDRLSLAFPSTGELAVRKVEFAEYLRSLDEAALPSDADFFKKLNHHAISASLLAQSDAEIYRSIREEFGSAGVRHLIERLSPRHGALLFALVRTDFQHEVARSLSNEVRHQVARQLLLSNRISPDEQAHVFAALDAARAGRTLPPPPPPAPHGISDRGREVDAAAALSVLLTHVPAPERAALLTEALERSGGVFPLWYENILFPQMLLKLPQELRADVLLEVDMRGLAGWSSVQHPSWQTQFFAQLTPSLQAALRANMSFGSNADRLVLARRGHQELVSAMKRLVSRGSVSFAEMVT